MADSLRIWVNRSYATTLHAVHGLRDNPDGVDVTVVGTHADRDSPVLTGCDEVADEPPPDVTGDRYGEWALDFAARHRIDVLWPRYEQEAVARAAGSFAAAGTAVVSPPAEVIARCEDKAATYEAAASAGLEVPPWRVATDAAGLRAALADLGAEVGPDVALCVKPVGGVGAVGFRIVRDRPPTWAQLQADPEPVVGAADLVRAYAEAAAPAGGALATGTTTGTTTAAGAGHGEPPGALLVQPWLDEPELSVDLLADRGVVLAAVTRGKPVGDAQVRARWVGADPALDAPVAALSAALGLHSLANVQFRWWRGRPVLLEVNPRASAGIHQTTLAGVDLAWAAVRLARGLPVGTLPAPTSARYADVPGVVTLPARGRRLDG